MFYTVSSSSNVKVKTPIYSSNNVYDKVDRKPGYLTEDEFFDVLITAFKSSYGDKNNTLWHPVDIYANAVAVLEIVCNTLNALVDLNMKRPISDVKSF